MTRLTIVVSLAASLPMLFGETELSLSEAIRQAQTTHPQLRAAQERVRVARGQQIQAGLRPNPRLNLQSENARWWGSPAFSFPNDTDDFVTVSQVFEVGGKRASRLELAAAGIRNAEAEQAVLARQIAGRVSLAYWAAAAAGSLRDLLQQDVTNFDRIVQYHRDRVREGAMAEVDLMRILLERDRLQVAAQSAEQEATRTLITLQREMGRGEFVPVRLLDTLTEIRDVAMPNIAGVLSQRPELDSARRAVEHARANLRLQRSSARPDPDATFGYKRTSGFDTLMGSIQIDLPFRNRNQGAIASAEAEIRVAEAQVKAVENQIRAEVAGAWAEFEARRRMVTGTLRPMRERADEIARIAEAAYREGGTDLLRLLDAERARIESLTMYYRALADYQQSITSLQIVTGAPL